MIQALREVLAVFSVDTTAVKEGLQEGNKAVDAWKNKLAQSASALVDLESIKLSSSAAESFRALGLTLTDAQGGIKSTEQVLHDLAASMEGLDAAEKRRRLVKAFGEQGAAIAPLLEKGTKGVQELTADLASLGLSANKSKEALAALKSPAGLKEANKEVSLLTQGFRQLIGPLTAALGGAAVVGFTNELIKSASAAKKTADALGLGVVELQEWQHAGETAGVATEQTTVAITKLGQKIAQAKAGNTDMAKTFKSLGIDLDELSSIAEQSLGDAFEHVGLALAGLEDNAQRTDVAMKLFEESGPKLFNIFKDGAEGVEAMREEVEALGVAFDDDFVKGATEYEKNAKRLTMAGQGLLLQFVRPLLPALVDFSESLVGIAKQVIPVVREFVSWIRQTKLLQTALLVLSGKALMMGVGLLTKWIAGVGGLSGALTALARLVLRVVAPFLILEDAITFLAGGKSLLGRKLDDWLGDGTSDKVRSFIGEIGNFVSTVTGGLENIKGVGDWMLAALNIVWTELKFAGLGAAASIQDAFTNTWNSIVAGAQQAIRAIADATSKLPLTGGFLSENINAAANSLGSLRGEDGHASTDVQKQLQDARMAIVADIEAAQTRMTLPSPRGAAAVSQDIQQTTQVNVTVPPGTSASMANRVGKAARDGAREGSSRNLRATHAALVPRPVG